MSRTIFIHVLFSTVLATGFRLSLKGFFGKAYKMPYSFVITATLLLDMTKKRHKEPDSRQNNIFFVFFSLDHPPLFGTHLNPFGT